MNQAGAICRSHRLHGVGTGSPVLHVQDCDAAGRSALGSPLGARMLEAAVHIQEVQAYEVTARYATCLVLLRY